MFMKPLKIVINMMRINVSNLDKKDCIDREKLIVIDDGSYKKSHRLNCLCS